MEISNRQKRKYSIAFLIMFLFVLITSCSGNKVNHKVFIKDKNVLLGASVMDVKKDFNLRQSYDYNEVEYRNGIQVYYTDDFIINNDEYMDVSFTNTISFTFQNDQLVKIWKSMTVDEENLTKNIGCVELENRLNQIKEILISENKNNPPNIEISKEGYWHIISEWKLKGK